MADLPSESDLIRSFLDLAEDIRARESVEGFRAYLQAHANDSYHAALTTSIRFMADPALSKAVQQQARDYVHETLYNRVFQYPVEMTLFAGDAFAASTVEADRKFFATVAIVAGEALFYQHRAPQEAIEAVTWLCLEKAQGTGVDTHERALHLVSNAFAEMINSTNPDEDWRFFETIKNLSAWIYPPEESKSLTPEQRQLWSLAQNALEQSLATRWESLSPPGLLQNVNLLAFGVPSCNGFFGLDDVRAARLVAPMQRVQELADQSIRTSCYDPWRVVLALAPLMAESEASMTTLQRLARNDRTDDLFKEALGQLEVEDAIFEYSQIGAVHRFLPEVWKETLTSPVVPEKRKMEILQGLLGPKTPNDLGFGVLPQDDAERERFIRTCLAPPPSRKASPTPKP